MNSTSHIFRAYDIRGIFNEDLESITMLKIAQAFGTFLKKKSINRITIGGDIRASTQTLLHAFISGISSVGISGELIKQSPLGITLFNSFNKKFGASAFITASHLPPDWNGVKFYWGEGIGFSPAENKEIQEIFEQETFDKVSAFDTGNFVEVNPFNEFVDYLKTHFNFDRKFKIGLDCGNGATSLVVPELFEKLGFEVISIFDTPDPKFPNRSSEPNRESLSQFSKFLKDKVVDFAAGFDGDGDRCVILDENGEILTADEFGIIVAKFLMKKTGKNEIIINMECSVTMEKQLEALGANVNRIRVGHSFLSLEAKKTGAIWGIEDSGHAIVPEIFLFDDALILPMVFAAAIQNEKSKVSEIRKSISLPIKKRFDLKCPDDTKFHKLDEIISYFKSQEGESNDTDGISFTISEGRILVRVSNTSPKIRVTIESIDQSGFDKIQSLYLNEIKKLIG